jgi:hypothetical protein
VSLTGLGEAFWGYYVVGGAVLGVVASIVVERTISPWPALALAASAWYVLWAANLVWSAAGRSTGVLLPGLAKLWIVVATVINLILVAATAVSLLVEADVAREESKPETFSSAVRNELNVSEEESKKRVWDAYLESYIRGRPDFFENEKNAAAFQSALTDYGNAIGSVENEVLLDRVMDLAQSRLANAASAQKAPRVRKTARERIVQERIKVSSQGEGYGPEPKVCPPDTRKVGNQCCTRGGWIQNEGGSETMIPVTCS